MANNKNLAANAAGNAQGASVNAKVAHSAYDKDLREIFGVTKSKHLDVHTTAVDVRNGFPSNTEMGKRVREKWSDLFPCILKYLPHYIDDKGRICVGKWVDARDGVAEVLISDKKRVIKSYKYDFESPETNVSENQSTLAIMHEVRIACMTQHTHNGETYDVPLREKNEAGKLVQVYRTETKKRVFVPFDAYGFAPCVLRAMRAAFDEVFGVVEPKAETK